jgi:hypothetical protein
MNKPSATRASNEAMMKTLSVLMLDLRATGQGSPTAEQLRGITESDFADLVALANRNHVVVRGIGVFREIMLAAGDEVRAGWAEDAITAELERIALATGFLRIICDAFDEAGLDVTVIKSLDHWPDFGSDIDLYTNASSDDVRRLMHRKFTAELESRSWGDKLASKWNFAIPGLPEPVEVHAGRLGQTGEQLVLASRLPARSRLLDFGSQSFRVASVSDRLMISTLQRMYRHFYFRLCDIADSAQLADSEAIDYNELRSSAKEAGIWEGVATYLVLVSDYVKSYRGFGLNLPSLVTEAARFDGKVLHFGGGFLRVPIMPQAVGLYRQQIAGLLRRRELHSSARLGLLPCLATAAAIGYKITGSDKGIW